MDACSMDWSPGDGVVHPAMYGRTHMRMLSGVSSGKTLQRGSTPLKWTCALWEPGCAEEVITTVGTWRYEVASSGRHACSWLLRSMGRANSSCVSARGRSGRSGDSCWCSSSLSSPARLHSIGRGLPPSFLEEALPCLPYGCLMTVPTL